MKSISPRIAASVTSRTSSSRPAYAASISMTSPWTRVESTSKTMRRLARCAMPTRWTATSTPARCEAPTSAWRSAASEGGDDPGVEMRSSSPVTG